LTTKQSVLRVRDLGIWRGERCLFEALDFDLDPGQLALVVGVNGSGKTTLLRILAGLGAPTTGTVTWDGTAVESLPAERRADVAYRGHLDGLKKDLTVAENLDFHRRLWSNQTEVAPLLNELKLEHAIRTRVRHLSAGQRRRTALATLQLSGAKLWILDEPMTNLDTEGRALMVGWTRRHVAAGGLAVVATHQPEDFETSGTLVIEL
jgi:heme exporter protein A